MLPECHNSNYGLLDCSLFPPSKRLPQPTSSRLELSAWEFDFQVCVSPCYIKALQKSIQRRFRGQRVDELGHLVNAADRSINVSSCISVTCIQIHYAGGGCGYNGEVTTKTCHRIHCPRNNVTCPRTKQPVTAGLAGASSDSLRTHQRDEWKGILDGSIQDSSHPIGYRQHFPG